ncbi:hypothetical protein PB1_03710 [Bacillus methanolicus PB1]|uniref:YhcU family protein n=1 Tax=Bacillus methanolicus PB1 TaxID=997296 RepID=I3E692_BACMT|nr:YhcU family protein [Bacillus methanolicus]EIJ82013.1 hypothetical protein PB1_03710 [Bacillus methanolicus PB1]
MKVVYASTPDQEQKIKELVDYFYSNVFPLYFSDEDIKEFKLQKVLHTSTRHFEYFGTLKEAYQVIASLQTLISILETSQNKEKYYSLFMKNASMLEEFDIYFPFTFSQFSEVRSMRGSLFSVYVKAANDHIH